jgi:hypothetical protein
MLVRKNLILAVSLTMISRTSLVRAESCGFVETTITDSAWVLCISSKFLRSSPCSLSPACNAWQ